MTQKRKTYLYSPALENAFRAGVVYVCRRKGGVLHRWQKAVPCRMLWAAVLLTAFSSCATKGWLVEGDIEIKKVDVFSFDDIPTEKYKPYVIQQPGMRGGKRVRVAYDTLLTQRTCRDITQALATDGYLDAEVSSACHVRKGKRRQPTCHVMYLITPRKPYFLGTVTFDIADGRIDSLLRREYRTQLCSGKRFSVQDLDRERTAICSFLQSRGYYKFNRDFIRFLADTVGKDHTVDVTLQLVLYRANSRMREQEHPKYFIRNIEYSSGTEGEEINLRTSVLDENTMLQEGREYDASALQSTYRRFARLNALAYTNIDFTEQESDSLDKELDCKILLSPRKPNSISIQPEGTNTSGNLGAALSMLYENFNIFRGSEKFSLELRGAYEAITGLEGYNNKDYIEYGVESRLEFPRYIIPFISRTFRRNVQSWSELSVAYNVQNRPEFHRKMFSAKWTYKWSEPRHHSKYTLDVLDMNYIYMPWISETFKKDYLDSLSNYNAILRYNYDDLFIMRVGFGGTYNNGVNALRFNIETAGNILSALAKAVPFGKNDKGQYTLFKIAYAQYVKADIDFTHVFPMSLRSELVLHGGLGIAYPYGNSDVLPFEKRYFSGGANSVRGWSVRGLGPGSYSVRDGRIDFINQTGDVKIDINMEYRTYLFWKVYGAAFLDAGNIWTIRNYEGQPGGQFRFNRFYRQFAVAYGLGLRLNFNYFILRFDCGMKAVNPVYKNSREHYPVFHPQMSRDCALPFAVGMPF